MNMQKVLVYSFFNIDLFFIIILDLKFLLARGLEPWLLSAHLEFKLYLLLFVLVYFFLLLQLMEHRLRKLGFSRQLSSKKFKRTVSHPYFFMWSLTFYQRLLHLRDSLNKLSSLFSRS
jgi:hypothetical protein